MTILRVKLSDLVSFLSVSELQPIHPIIKDDTLFDVLHLPNLLVRNKILRTIAFIYFTFFIFETIGVLWFLALTNQWDLFLTQYSVMAAGCFSVMSTYSTTYTTSHDFETILWDIFPKLWPLDSVGEKNFNKFQRTAKLLKSFSTIAVISCLLTATAGLPWFGDEYELYMPVKFFTDVFGKWRQPFIIMFYTSFYHGGLTVFTSFICLAYILLHLLNQCYLLNQKLESLKRNVAVEDLQTTLKNDEYQNSITVEIVSCIKHHQTLIRFLGRVNHLIYFPIFYFTASGICFILAIILCPRNPTNLIRIVFITILAIFLVAGLCFLAQRIENESEQIFYSAYSTPWYLWNKRNRNLLVLLLVKAQRNMELSSSGIITINFKLIIGLGRTVYSLLTVLLNISKSKS